MKAPSSSLLVESSTGDFPIIFCHCHSVVHFFPTLSFPCVYTHHLSHHSIVSFQPPLPVCLPCSFYFLFPTPPLCLRHHCWVLSLPSLYSLSLCTMSYPQPKAWLTSGSSLQRHVSSPDLFILAAITSSQRRHLTTPHYLFEPLFNSSVPY